MAGLLILSTGQHLGLVFPSEAQRTKRVAACKVNCSMQRELQHAKGTAAHKENLVLASRSSGAAGMMLHVHAAGERSVWFCDAV